MKKLERYGCYTRKEIHDIFSPNTNFTPQAGTWGLQGIVSVPDSLDDFVFMVTYGRKQGEHKFEERITEDGILFWQSQPQQSLASPQIKKFINHDEQINTIYLFLRTSVKEKEYIYLGELAYLEHDSTKEKPVYFKWQILDFNLEATKRAMNNLVIQPRQEVKLNENNKNKLEQTDIPQSLSKKKNRALNGDHHIGNLDFAKKGKENDSLGLAGEEVIVSMEKQRLIEVGREDLADKVALTRETIGNIAPFDIRSFDEEGNELAIEVKTTTGSINTSFYVSIKEVLYSIKYSDRYKLYRIYEFDEKGKNGKFYVLEGDLSEQLNLEPIQFRANIEKENDVLIQYWKKMKEINGRN